jgi:hypothetical protein
MKTDTLYTDHTSIFNTVEFLLISEQLKYFTIMIFQVNILNHTPTRLFLLLLIMFNQCIIYICGLFHVSKLYFYIFTFDNGKIETFPKTYQM